MTSQYFQTLYTRKQFKAGVESAFRLGRIEGADGGSVPVGVEGQYKKVRIKRSTCKKKKFKIQLYRCFHQIGVRWIDVARMDDEDMAVAFLEDLVMCLAKHEKRQEIKRYKQEQKNV